MPQSNLVNSILNTLEIPKSKAEEIASHFCNKIIHKNEFALNAGKVSNDYLYLESGIMRAFTYNLNGDEITTTFYTNSQFVFEVSSLFKRKPSSENIQALTDCNVWLMNYDTLQSLFHSMPEFRELGRRLLVNGFINF